MMHWQIAIDTPRPRVLRFDTLEAAQAFAAQSPDELVIEAVEDKR